MLVNNTVSLQRPVDYYLDITERDNILKNYSIEFPKSSYTTRGVNSDLQSVLERLYNNVSNTDSTNTTCIGESMQQIKYCKELKKIEYNNHIYEFNENFIYVIYLCDGIFVAENEYFNVYGYGDTVKDAEEDMACTLEDLWNIYVLEDDNNLDDGAKELKLKLQKNITRKECKI
jgi:hypothetical protein